MKNNNFNNKTNYVFGFLGKINWVVYFSLVLLTLIGSTILFSVSHGTFYPLVSSHLIKLLISSIEFFVYEFMSQRQTGLSPINSGLVAVVPAIILVTLILSIALFRRIRQS